MEQIEPDRYRLSTGREFYANRGIVGMSPQFADRHQEYNDCVPEGYDGSICVNDRWSEPEEYWTGAEQHELADYMIALWQRWKSAVIVSGNQDANAERADSTRRSESA
jgi:hypothetical protein